MKKAIITMTIVATALVSGTVSMAAPKTTSDKSIFNQKYYAIGRTT